MSGYAYTYPHDDSYLDVLPAAQRDLAHDLLRKARLDGADLQDLLRKSDAPATDKVAVAEAFGGAGAGREFLDTGQ